ncbi:MAG TPA: ATP-binding protein, partial [Candidatus Limnocylindrales bacterium]|nr:ATP-binding protein [Candidatus Limnocylindrales bacterium]
GFRGGSRGEESKRNRGWGLKLIRELVDDVEIATGDRGTVVRMVKYLGAVPGEEGAGPPGPE